MLPGVDAAGTALPELHFLSARERIGTYKFDHEYTYVYNYIYYIYYNYIYRYHRFIDE